MHMYVKVAAVAEIGWSQDRQRQEAWPGDLRALGAAQIITLVTLVPRKGSVVCKALCIYYHDWRSQNT